MQLAAVSKGGPIAQTTPCRQRRPLGGLPREMPADPRLAFGEERGKALYARFAGMNAQQLAALEAAVPVLEIIAGHAGAGTAAAGT